MDPRRRVSRFTYRIETKPEGGYIARPVDSNAATLEAPTREELDKKIQDTILAGLSTQFPGLKLPTENRPTSYSNTGTIVEAGNAKPTDGVSGSLGGTIGNSPIQAEASSSGKVMGILLLALVVAAVVYFFLQRR
ncbi:MAG TPA: hypothetical protein VGS20_00355 [Candidatus Acidoferrales bacterium]|nr:hypothetical protein [Candidatus Acidoferrales bacterium]